MAHQFSSSPTADCSNPNSIFEKKLQQKLCAKAIISANQPPEHNVGLANALAPRTHHTLGVRYFLLGARGGLDGWHQVLAANQPLDLRALQTQCPGPLIRRRRCHEIREVLDEKLSIVVGYSTPQTPQSRLELGRRRKHGDSREQIITLATTTQRLETQWECAD